jgi:2-C-methyl-D-erythritol 2,4-cyclodiphosphate synthase
MGLRVGLGYDVHKLAENRKLIMGGVEIPYELGLLGHSDADVLVHAIMDALVGAVKLGDIGKLFPDTDPQYKDISSAFEKCSIGRAAWSYKGVDYGFIDGHLDSVLDELVKYL